MNPARAWLGRSLAALLLMLSTAGGASAAMLRYTGFVLDEPSAPWAWNGVNTEDGAEAGYVLKQRNLVLIVSEGVTDTLVQDLPGFLAYWRDPRRPASNAVWRLLSREARLDSTFGVAVRLDEVWKRVNLKDSTRVEETSVGRTYLFPHPQSGLLYLRAEVSSHARGEQMPAPPQESDLALLRSLQARPLDAGVDLYRRLPMPGAMVEHAGGLWVACMGAVPTGRPEMRGGAFTWGEVGTLVRVDASTGAIASSTAAGRMPAGVAVTDGAVWVANFGDETVHRFDEATAERRGSLKVGGQPGALAATRAGVWVGLGQDGSLARIGPGADSVVLQGVFPGGKPRKGSRDAISALAAADSLVLAGTEKGLLCAVDAASGATRWKRRWPRRVLGILSAPGAVWVASQSDSLRRILPATGEVVERIALDEGRSPAGPMAVSHGILFVAMTDGTVCRWRAESGQPTGAPIFVGRKPTSMVASEGGVWVASQKDAAVVRIAVDEEPGPAPAPLRFESKSSLGWNSEPVVGYHYSEPQRFGLTLGMLWFRPATPQAIFPVGWSVQVDVAASGGGAGVGWCRIGKDPGGPPLLGATVRGKFVYTWGSPLVFGPDEVLGGPELTLHFLAGRFSVAYLWPFDRSRSKEPDGAVVIGYGVGF